MDETSSITQHYERPSLVEYLRNALATSALSLPFPSETFDVAWTQHVAMNGSGRSPWRRRHSACRL